MNLDAFAFWMVSVVLSFGLGMSTREIANWLDRLDRAKRPETPRSKDWGA